METKFGFEGEDEQRRPQVLLSDKKHHCFHTMAAIFNLRTNLHPIYSSLLWFIILLFGGNLYDFKQG